MIWIIPYWLVGAVIMNYLWFRDFHRISLLSLILITTVGWIPWPIFVISRLGKITLLERK